MSRRTTDLTCATCPARMRRHARSCPGTSRCRTCRQRDGYGPRSLDGDPPVPRWLVTYCDQLLAAHFDGAPMPLRPPKIRAVVEQRAA